MSIEFKIMQGTGKLTGQSLCRSCREAHIYVDRAGEHVVCNHMRAREIRGDVFTCSAYDDKGLPWLSDLRAIAWQLSTDAKGKSAGFKPPKRRGEDD